MGWEIGVIGIVSDWDEFAVSFHYRFRNTMTKAFVSCESDHFGPSCTMEEVEGKGWITFMFLMGCAVGAIVAGYLCDWIGRKWTSFVGASLFLTGTITQSLSYDIECFYLGRSLSGVGIGLITTAIPVFIAEISAVEIRGVHLGFFQLAMTFGILFASICSQPMMEVIRDNSYAAAAEAKINITSLAFGTNIPIEDSWRTSIEILMIPALVMMVFAIFMPESPRWLAAQGRDSEALATLSWLRDADITSTVVQEEYYEIKSHIDFGPESVHIWYKDLLQPSVCKRVLLCMGLHFFQQFSGINVVLFYENDLFDALGFRSLREKDNFALALAVVNFLGTYPGLMLVDRIGRKKVLLYGSMAMAFSYLGMIVASEVMHATSGSNKAAAWVLLIFLSFFFAAFSASWGPVVWIYTSEVFPAKLRAKGVGIATFINWLSNATLAKLSLYLIKYIGSRVYIIFFFFCVMMGLLSHYYVVETKKVALEDMDDLFNRKKTCFEMDEDEKSLEIVMNWK